MTRQCHIYPTRMIAHLWATQKQEWAANPQRNISFHGKVLRSYSTDIACLTDYTVEDEGAYKNVVLIDSRRYSTTTSRHQSEARSALNNARYFVFSVPIIQPGTPTHHKLNAEHLWDVYHKKAFYLRSPIARVWSQGEDVEARLVDLVDRLQVYLNRYNMYNEYVRKCRLPAFTVCDSVKEGARAAIERNLRWQAEYDARQERARAKMRIEEQERLTKWLEGDTHVWLRSYVLDGVYLRLLRREDGNVIQTSMGAEIPEGHGQRIWAFIEMLRDRGETYQHNGHTQHVGQFRVDRIDADYTLWAGCHRIAYSRMYEFALKTWGA